MCGYKKCLSYRYVVVHIEAKCKFLDKSCYKVHAGTFTPHEILEDHRIYGEDRMHDEDRIHDIH